MKYEEQCEAYKRASKRINPLPPAILVSLAGCYLSKDSTLISSEEAEKLVRQALEQEESIEAVILIRGICKDKGDEKQFIHWNKVLEKLEKERAYMKNKWPEFLKTVQLN